MALTSVSYISAQPPATVPHIAVAQSTGSRVRCVLRSISFTQLDHAFFVEFDEWAVYGSSKMSATIEMYSKAASR